MTAEVQRAPGARWARLVLLAGSVVFAVLSVVLGTWRTSEADLRDAVRSGQVHEITVDWLATAPTEEVTWRSGLRRHSATVTLSDALQGDGLAKLRPGLVVHDDEDLNSPSVVRVPVLGLDVPTGLVSLYVLLVLGCLGVLVRPTPAAA